MKILQINTTTNVGSHGRIAGEIGDVVMQHGSESYIAYGRSEKAGNSTHIKIGNKADQAVHGLKSRFFDRHGFGSTQATRRFIQQMDALKPDVIHLHNIHGYYVNIEKLFEYFKRIQKPLVWTFHDFWPVTGHCSYFDAVNCFKWQVGCEQCPNIKSYPKSYVDRSRRNYLKKKALFTGLENLTLVSPSKWLASHLQESFLKHYPIKIIHNGINLNVFHPVTEPGKLDKFNLVPGSYILGVANGWNKRKGLSDFLSLRKLLKKDIAIVLAGLTEKQMAGLPEGVLGIPKTEQTEDLAVLYSFALAYANPTYIDNFPTTNLEALACGTPVITYNTGGSPESVDQHTGFVVDQGDIAGLNRSVHSIIEKGKEHFAPSCRQRAENLFNMTDRFNDYFLLYQDITNDIAHLNHHKKT